MASMGTGAKTLWTAVALVLLGLLALGCEGRVLHIRQNQVPSKGCKLVTAATVHNPRGILDVSIAQGYMLYPLLENTMEGSMRELYEVNDRHLAVMGFEVSLDLQGFESLPNVDIDAQQLKFWEPISGSIPPGGRMVSKVKVVSGWMAMQMRHVLYKTKGPDWPVIYAKVVAVARTQDESEVESGEFVFPIEVCHGCLVDLRYWCPAPYPIQYNTCGLPQDEPVTCCAKSKGYYCYKD